MAVATLGIYLFLDSGWIELFFEKASAQDLHLGTNVRVRRAKGWSRATVTLVRVNIYKVFGLGL